MGKILKILGGIFLLFIIIGIIGAATGDKKSTPDTTSSAPSAASSDSKSTPAPEENKPAITKENYDKIKKGMTMPQVKKILGEPSMVSESETPGVGKMDMHHYQETFGTEAIDITYLNGKVYTKNWVKL